MKKDYPNVVYISENEVESLLMEDAKDYISYLQTRIKSISKDSSKTDIKAKVIYDDPISPEEGDIRSMTCFTDRVKVVKIISTNPVRKKHWSVSVGATLLLDYVENHPIAIFDATMMSSIRTSAMAVLGAMFAQSDLDDILIIGYGRVGISCAEILRQHGKNIRVYDPAVSEHDIMSDNIDFTSNLERFEASTIITATTSRKPFLTSENTKADFIVSVGADTAFNFELSEDLIVSRGGLYVDCPDAMHVGDLSQVKDNEKLVQGDILTLEKAQNNVNTLVSVGSPLMDALTIEYMANKLNLI